MLYNDEDFLVNFIFVIVFVCWVFNLGSMKVFIMDDKFKNEVLSVVFMLVFFYNKLKLDFVEEEISILKVS